MVIKNEADQTLFQLEKNLKEVEELIYNLEECYLQETLNTGNVIRGWECSKIMAVNKGMPQNPKKVKIQERERMFSLSSCTSIVNQTLKREAENSESKSVVSPGQNNNFIKSRRKARTNNYIRAVSRNFKNKIGRNGNESEGDLSLEQSDQERSNKKSRQHLKYQKPFGTNVQMHLIKTSNGIHKKKNKKKK